MHIQIKTWLLMATVSLLVACNADSGRNNGVFDQPASAGKARFIVLGDVGTGYCTEIEDADVCPQPQSLDEEHGQMAVAQVVEQVCAQRGCDFATMGGDNIYEQGVDGVDSFRFQDTFEIPYKNLNFPFFISLGNHDNSLASSLAETGGFYGEGRRNARGDFQVEYSARSDKWVMPARFYSQTWPRNSRNPLVEIFVLDSSPITHYIRDESGWYSEGFEDYLMDQTAWLQDALANSKARWKVALAHHPYISNGDHGNAGSYDQIEIPPPLSGPALDGCTAFPVGYAVFEPGTVPLADPSCRGRQYKQMLEQTICDNVDVMLQGHDHDLQWLQPTEACGKTQFMVSGAGGKFRDLRNQNRNAAKFQKGGAFGFFWVEMDANGSMTVAVYGVERGDEGGQSLNLDSDGQPVALFEETVAQTVSQP